jgi:anti-anti-sigma factor
MKTIWLKDEGIRVHDDPGPARPSSAVSLLDIRIAASEAGQVMTLSGEADVTTRARLADALQAQVAAGTRILMVELSGLRFADSATIAELAGAARVLKEQGGRLELLNPQPALARMLTLLGIDEILTVRYGETGPGPGPTR